MFPRLFRAPGGKPRSRAC